MIQNRICIIAVTALITAPLFAGGTPEDPKVPPPPPPFSSDR